MIVAMVHPQDYRDMLFRFQKLILSFSEIIEKVFLGPHDICDSMSDLEFIPYEQAYEAGFQDMLRRKPIVDKLEEFTGFRPERSLERIIRDTADFLEASQD